jgi:cation transport ATPase
MIKTIFQIKNLDCPSCAMAIEGICEDQPRVKKACVHVGKKQLVIEHEADAAINQLKSVLGREGYEVE